MAKRKGGTAGKNGASPVITWLDRARNKVRRQELMPLWDEELQAVFGDVSVRQITVCDLFQGFSNDEEQKIVLAVQTAVRSGVPGSHLVKLGQRRQVQCDLDGWEKTLVKRGIVSRLLSSIHGEKLAGNRFCVIYQDAYRLFGAQTDNESPRPLEQAAEWAIRDNNPASESLERLLIEMFSDLNRCCYRTASENTDRAINFYNTELQKDLGGKGRSAWDRWQDDDLQTLRRDAQWLTLASRKSDEGSPPSYLDPFDWLRWALNPRHASRRVPSTLAGPAHGDLHGRNIVVGVIRGSVFQPAVFDYGDMAPDNLPVWDFVKLEMELKCRILPELCRDQQAKAALAYTASRSEIAAPSGRQFSADEQLIAHRVERMRSAFHFELILAGMTANIVSQDAASAALPSSDRSPTGHEGVDRALCLLLRLRQEAAYWLGYQTDRSQAWRDEYFFALAAYGLLVAKWPVDDPHVEWALMSSGVAVAQLGQVKGKASEFAKQLGESKSFSSRTLPQSHLIPMATGFRLWQDGEHAQAVKVLSGALKAFPASVGLRQVLALCQAARKDLTAASGHVESLRPLCRIFQDHETLCRLGRIYKEWGDADWKRDRPTLKEFIRTRHPGHQLYQEAFKVYHEAHDFSRHYYPGINAATLAVLIGDTRATNLAQDVAHTCASLSVDDIDERFWIFVTEGEAALLLNRRSAVSFYESAFNNPKVQELSYCQAVYDQLCRLHWAFGTARIKPILALMKKHDLLTGLKRGPFLNCKP